MSLDALVVEDDPASCAALAELLDIYGFAPRTAITLAEARQALHTTTPDLLVIDHHLPDGDGLDLLRELTQTPRPAIICISGDDSLEPPIAPGDLVYVLQKPLDITRLKAALTAISERARM